MEQQRKEYLDVLRALATIGVIIIHVSSNNWFGYIGSFNWMIFTVYEGITRVSVPIFFMISGSLLLSKTYTIKKLYLNKILKLVFFLLVWSLVYKIMNLPEGTNILQRLFIALEEIINGNTQTHLWFIYAITGLYIITPALSVFVNNCNRNILLYTIIICFILGSFCDFTSQFQSLSFFTNNLNKIKSGYAIGYIGYYLLGYYLDKLEFNDVKKYILYILGIVSTILTIGLVIRDCITYQNFVERFWSYSMPFIVLSSCAWFIFIKNISSKLNRVILNILADISAKSLGIYAVHFLFIILFWQHGFTTFLFNGIISVPVISMVVFACSYIVSTIVRKIPKIGKYLA